MASRVPKDIKPVVDPRPRNSGPKLEVDPRPRRRWGRNTGDGMSYTQPFPGPGPYTPIKKTKQVNKVYKTY